MRLHGKVREVDEERIVLADMTWSLRTFPVAAGVTINDDPARRLPEAYNVMPWPRKAAITLAGPASNIMLTVAALVIVAVFPITAVNALVLTVSHVEPGGPAARAGMLPGDRIVQVGNRLNPNTREIREKAADASRKGRVLRVRVIRQGESVNLRVKPGPGAGKLGIMLDAREIQGRDYPMTPQATGQRMRHLGESYIDALAGLFSTLTEEESDDRLEMVSGPVMGAYQSA